ncbi:MAG TPA: MBL fold metallo-hydrolase, partial [Methanocella sp.]|nr:MBL fold metallo-hydrolase [Methanocella sp.]
MRITDHVHALKLPFRLIAGPGITVERFVYTYLIYGRQIYLIDTGVAPSVEAIFKYVRSTGRRPEEISMAILTHSHPDHIGGAAEIRRLTGCSMSAHGAEKPWIEDVGLQYKERPVPGFHTIVGGPVSVDRVLEDGDVLELEDGLHLEVFHTPGHSKGSVSLLLREEMALFSGDVIPLASDAPIYDDAVESVRSIKRLKNITGLEWLLSAWDGPRKGGQIYRTMDEGLDYLQRVHGAVLNNSGMAADPATMCRHVLRELGLPEKAMNPLAIRSVEANLRAR